MRYFDRWYDPADRERRVYPAVRPDALIVDEYVGINPLDASPLTESCQAEVHDMVFGMIEASREDWPSYLPVSGPMDNQWIDAFDKHHNKSCIKKLIKASDPTDFSNELIVRCCEFGAVIGSVMIETLPGLHWVYDWPYWDSSIFDPDAGMLVYVFHWSIKKFSSYGIDDGFSAKLVACCRSIEEERQKR